LTQYWRRFRVKDMPRIQGGFIWDFCDQGLLLSDKSGYGYGGDFGDYPNTKQFCCNGILGPSRQPFPSAFEAAHLQSPVEVSLFYSAEGQMPFKGRGEDIQEAGHRLVISNRRSFRSLSDVTVVVTLNYHQAGIKPLVVFDSMRIDGSSIAAGGYQIVSLDNYLKEAISKGPKISNSVAAAADGVERSRVLEVINGSEAWLDVIAVKSLDPMLDRMALAYDKEPVHEVLHASLKVPSLLEMLEGTLRTVELPPGGEADIEAVGVTSRMRCLAMAEGDDSDHTVDCIIIRWTDGSNARIGRSCGRLVSWVDRNGSSLLASPLDGCIYRAGTDNDRGGMGVSYYARWKECGLDTLVRRSQETSVMSCIQSEEDGAVEVVTRWTWESPHADVPVTIPCSARYLFRNEGSIDVAFRVHISECSAIPPLPRCGLRWSLSRDFDRVSWFGRGPMEAYDDRNSAAYLGVFESQVEQLHTHYTFPQECARRADPRCVLIDGPVYHCCDMC